MKKPARFLLIHRITRKPLPFPIQFENMHTALWFALEHDLLADAVPLAYDLFGNPVPETPPEPPD